MDKFIAATRLPLADGAPSAALQLQQCASCNTVNYPARDLCGRCLADALAWQPQSGAGTLLASSTLHYSLEPALHGQLPIIIGSVKLAVGPVVITYLAASAAIGASVTVQITRDCAGNPVLSAQPTEERPHE